MKQWFDFMPERRENPYSYSIKWGQDPFVAQMVGVQNIAPTSIPLFIADMDFRAPEPILQALHSVVEHGNFGYCRQEMSAEYFHSITGWFQRRHGWCIQPDELVYVNGTVEAIRQILLAFTKVGEGVVIQPPVYGPFAQAISHTGRTVVNNPLIADVNLEYQMDFEDLELKLSDPNNRILLLCSPHNPVGRVWKDNELREVAKLCARYDVLLVADEIHCDLIRRESHFIPCAPLCAEEKTRFISCTAASKTFNIPSLHATNVVISDPDLRKQFVQSMGFVGPSPFTLAATTAAYRDCAEWVDQLNLYLDDTIDFALNFLQKRLPKVRCRRPEGTYFLWMDWRPYGVTEEEIHRRIYEEAEVLLENGKLFDPENGAGFERMCLPSPRDLIAQALERIAVVWEKPTVQIND